MILAHKDNLPLHSKRSDYPTMLWVLAPQHYNFPNNWNLHRQKFSKCLEIAVQLYAQMNTLKLLKIWNYDDSNLLRDKRFTAAGLQAYWASLDSAFRHQDTFIVVKQSLKGAKSEQKRRIKMEKSLGHELIDQEVQRFKKFKSSGKFHWQKRNSILARYRTSAKCKLPRPPYQDTSSEGDI